MTHPAPSSTPTRNLVDVARSNTAAMRTSRVAAVTGVFVRKIGEREATVERERERIAAASPMHVANALANAAEPLAIAGSFLRHVRPLAPIVAALVPVLEDKDAPIDAARLFALVGDLRKLAAELQVEAERTLVERLGDAFPTSTSPARNLEAMCSGRALVEAREVIRDFLERLAEAER